MATYTAEEYGQLLDRFAKGFPKAIQEATFQTAQQLNVMISKRIFNNGGTKDIEGGKRVYKSESYKKKRQGKGLQVNNVDLIFNTDLQRSPKLFSAKNTVDLKIVGKLNVDKARGNEALFGAKVFEASKREEKIALEVFEEVIADYIEKLFD